MKDLTETEKGTGTSDRHSLRGATLSGEAVHPDTEQMCEAMHPQDGAPSAVASGVMTSPEPVATSAPAVLLVDDRPENLLALEAALSTLAAESGARLLRAGNADEALRHVLREGGALALVLLDVMMPGTNGLDTARMIRQRTLSEHIPIIFITALDNDRRRLTLGYQFGAVDYLIKPVDPEVLQAKVRAFLELHQRRGDAVLAERRRYADEVHALREETLRDEAALIATVQRVGTALASELDLEQVVQLVTDEATALARAQLGVFFYSVENPTRASADYRHYSVARVTRERFAGFSRPHARPAAGPTFQDDSAVRSDDISSDPDFRHVQSYFGIPAEQGTVRSYLAVPVRSRTGDVLGGLLFGHQDPGVFAEREERLVFGIAGWAAVAMDNARLYTAERNAREDAEAAARAKAEFLATMSHEFRTPLNAILGYAQLLDMGVLGRVMPAQHVHLERLQSSARHLSQLVDDVLDVAKVDAARLEVRREPLMTGAAVAAAVTLVQPQATAKGIRLLDLGGGEPGVPFMGDDHRVRQVLVNLLSNAVKFTPPGGQVTVTCGATEEPEPEVLIEESAHEDDAAVQGRWAFIKVEDTGPGIEPTLLDQLFEPFVQGDSALTREKGGTGLGLAISRRLARLMGGDITARSRLGERATFTLWLPGIEQDELTGTNPSAPKAPARRTPSLGRMAIAEPGGALPNDAAYAVLHALGVRLAAGSEAVAERYVAAMQADQRFPGVLELPTVQLRDHATSFVSLLAAQLMVIGETRGQAPELLRDGGHLQRITAELHGAQRYRLGWNEAEIERETAILLADIERTLHNAVNGETTARVTGENAPGEMEFSADAVHAATQYAVAVARHVLDRACTTSLRAYRFAKAADRP